MIFYYNFTILIYQKEILATVAKNENDILPQTKPLLPLPLAGPANNLLGSSEILFTDMMPIARWISSSLNSWNIFYIILAMENIYRTLDAS